MKTFDCYAPWLNGRPLINAVGSSETECHANLGLLDLSDEDLQRVEIRSAKLQIQEPSSLEE